MKKIMMLFVMVMMTIGTVQAQSKKCPNCGGSGVYRYKIEGYGVSQKKFGKCPNCGNHVDLYNHHCDCKRCNRKESISTGNSSSKKSASKPSGIYTGESPDLVQQAAFVQKCLDGNYVWEWTTCWNCGGDGVCKACKGAGWINGVACMNCSMRGKCITCMGNKKSGKTRPMTPEERQKYLQWMKWYLSLSH